MIKGIAFDMDGLMFDTEKLAVDAWMMAGEELGLTIPYALVEETFGLTGALTRKILFRHFGDDFDCDGFFTVYRKYRQFIAEKEGIRMKKGLKELLDFLRENGYSYTVATSSYEKDARRNFEKTGTSHYFGAIVCGNMIQNSKPAPDIYLKACEILNLPPCECMALEDSPMGIRAAFAAGLSPVLVPDLAKVDKETEKMVYKKADSLLDVITLLKEERKRG